MNKQFFLNPCELHIDRKMVNITFNMEVHFEQLR